MAAYDLAPVNIGRLRAPTDDPLVAEFMNGPDEVDALADHVYRSDHTGFLRRRAAWFAPMDEAIAALWWVPAGHRPTEAEAVARLDHLHLHGPTANAVTFLHRFDPPDAVPARFA